MAATGTGGAMATPDLARLKRVNLREAWMSEPADFTPWLAQPSNLELLGESLGISLELESTEHSVGPFAADILCKDPLSDLWVLIENQLEQTDHTHLGQIITYAAGLNAVTVIWIAGKFVEQHRAALDWLNEITSEGTNFFGVEVELWRIGDSPQMAPKFNIVSKPNAWSKQVPKIGRSGRKWDEASFFADLKERAPDGVEPARALLVWAREKMPDIWWGEGAKDGSFYAGLQVGAHRHLAFCVWTYGKFELQFERMRSRPVFDDRTNRLDLLNMFNKEASLGISEERVEGRPNVDLVALNDPVRRDAVLRVLDWYVDQITSAESSD
jgi:hypothetical protein